MKRTWQRIALAAAVAALALPAAAQEIVIGLSYGGTGPYVTSSRTTETAVDLAVQEINAAGGVNGRKLRVAKFDTAGDPKQAALAVGRFSEQNAIAIVGPYATAEARVAFPVGEREQIVQISNSSTVPGVSKGLKWGFRLTTGDDLAFPALLSVMRERNIPVNTASIMYVSDDAGMRITGTDVFPKMLTAGGVRIVGEPVGFQVSAFDLAPQVAKVIPAKPDVVALAGVVEPAVKAVTELRRQGFQGRMIGSLLFANPDLAKRMGPAGDGTIYVSWFYAESSDKARKFVGAFNAENAKRSIDKTGPHHVDASAYDIVYVLAEAMRAAKVTGEAAKIKAERASLRDALEQVRYTGVSGATRFNQDHDAVLPLYVIEVQGGKTRLLGEKKPGG